MTAILAVTLLRRMTNKLLTLRQIAAVGSIACRKAMSELQPTAR